MSECKSCGKAYQVWLSHVRYSPHCKVATVPATAPSVQDHPKSGPGSSRADEIRWTEIANKLGRMVAHMHLQNKMLITHCDEAVSLASTAVSLVLDAFDAMHGAAPAVSSAVRAVQAAATTVMDKLRDVDKVCAEHTEGALSPISRPLLAPDDESKKHFAFFSLTHLICDMLQHDKEARQACIDDSAKIRTGQFRKPQTSLTDTKHGSRFAASPASRPAAPGEGKRLIIDIHSWDDDATVRCFCTAALAHTHSRRCLRVQWVKPIGVRRKEHKYSVVLIKINNLPKNIRTRRDKILLFGIWNVKFAKKVGGVLRMLCGVSLDGTVHSETCLRTELLQLMRGVEMDIPNDAVGGKERWIVEVHHTGWLADLLGAHGLGPWPESFQARHACRDCWWHTGCWCAHLPPGHRELRSKRPHAEGCRVEAQEPELCPEPPPRSLEELQQDLQELRSTTFTTKKAAADAHRDKGIARVHCALEHLGNNMSTDAAADISHLFLLGVSRHELFWMLEDMTQGTDAPFSYDELNVQRKRMNATLPSAHKISNLQRPTVDGKAKHQVNMNMTAAGTHTCTHTHTHTHTHSLTCSPTHSLTHALPQKSCTLR